MSTIASLMIKILADADGLRSELERSGRMTSDFEKNMERAGKIGAAALTAVTAMAVSTGAAIVVLTKGVAEAGEEFQKMSTLTGSSVGALSEIVYAAGLADIEMVGMVRSTKQLSMAMQEATTGSGEAAGVFSALGVSVRGSHGEMRNSLAVMMDVSDAFSRMTDETKRTAYASTLFGKSSSELVPFLSQGSAAIREQMAESRALGNTWDTVTARAAADLSDNYKRLAYAGQFMLETAMRPLIPVVNRIVVEMLDWIKANQEWLKASITSAMEKFGSAIEQGEKSLKTLKKTMEDLLSSKTVGLMGTIADVLLKISRVNLEIQVAGYIKALREVMPLLESISNDRLGSKLKESILGLFDPKNFNLAASQIDSQFAELVQGGKKLEVQNTATATAGVSGAEQHAAAMKDLNAAVGESVGNQKLLGEQIVKYTQIVLSQLDLAGKAQERMGANAVALTKVQLSQQMQANMAYFDTLETLEQKAAFIRDKQFTSGFRPAGQRSSIPGGPNNQQFEAVPGVSVAKFQETAGHELFLRFQDDQAAMLQLYDELEGKQLGMAENMLPKTAIDTARGRYQQYLGEQIVGTSRISDFWTQTADTIQQSSVFAFGSIRTSFGNTIVGLMQGTATWSDFWQSVNSTALNTVVQTGLNIVVEWIKTQYKQIVAQQAIEAMKTAVQAEGDAARVASSVAADATMLTGTAVTAGATVSIWAGATAAIVGFFGTVMASFGSMFATLVGVVTAVGEFIMGVLTAIAEALADTIFGSPWAVAILAGVVAIGIALAATGAIEFAKGGLVMGPTLGLVGEAGPEMIIPLDRLGEFGGGGEKTINVPVYLNGREIALATARYTASAWRSEGAPA